MPQNQKANPSLVSRKPRETRDLTSLTGHPKNSQHTSQVRGRKPSKVELPLKLCNCWLGCPPRRFEGPTRHLHQCPHQTSPIAHRLTKPVSTTSGRFVSSTPPRAPDHHQRDPPARVPSLPRLPKSPRCSGGPCPGHFWAFHPYSPRAIPPILPTWASSPEKTSPPGASHPSHPSPPSSPRSASIQEAPASNHQQAPSVRAP